MAAQRGEKPSSNALPCARRPAASRKSNGLMNVTRVRPRRVEAGSSGSWPFFATVVRPRPFGRPCFRHGVGIMDSFNRSPLRRTPSLAVGAPAFAEYAGSPPRLGSVAAIHNTGGHRLNKLATGGGFSVVYSSTASKPLASEFKRDPDRSNSTSPALDVATTGSSAKAANRPGGIQLTADVGNQRYAVGSTSCWFLLVSSSWWARRCWTVRVPGRFCLRPSARRSPSRRPLLITITGECRIYIQGDGNPRPIRMCPRACRAKLPAQQPRRRCSMSAATGPINSGPGSFESDESPGISTSGPSARVSLIAESPERSVPGKNRPSGENTPDRSARNGPRQLSPAGRRLTPMTVRPC